jgi:catechol 2,3-dioxygenase-like lactoylglutathione lyase family enzyme
MPTIRHMAMCTENNRRLARFYRLIFGMDEVWNYEQNSPYAFYVSDGYFNLNCLQIHRTMAEQKRDIGINHYGFKVESIKEIGEKLGQLDPPIKFADRPKDGRYTEIRIKDPDGNASISPRRAGVPKRKRGIRECGMLASEPPIPSAWPTSTNLFSP